MSDYGMKDEGFVIKRFDKIKESLEASARLALGEDATLAPDSIEGQMINVFTGIFSVLWEELNNAYDAFNPSMAKNATLDHITNLNGLTRQDAAFSHVDLTIAGINNTTIPQGSSAGTSDTGVRFYLDEEITIPSGGSIITRATTKVSGIQGASAGTVTQILTPIQGWDSVTNVEDATPGRERETDEALRNRREKSLSLSGVSTVEALYSIISNVEGVSHSRVYENYTDATDANTLPPHSFCCVVRGGEDTDIGAGIWARKPSGILSYGNTAVVITDIQEMEHTLEFMRPVDLDIHLKITIKILVTDFPSDAGDLITEAILKYVTGDLIPGAGFNVGEDIINSRLYTPINLAVQGHTIEMVEMGLDGTTWAEDDIDINIFQVGLFTADNIEVIIS